MAGIPKIKITFDADFDELKKGVKGAQNEVEGFGSKMGGFAKKAGAAFAVAGAAAAAYAGVLLVDGVKSAIEDEAAQAKLATTLENVTGATKDQIAAVEDYITQTALANGITDDVLRPSLATVGPPGVFIRLIVHLAESIDETGRPEQLIEPSALLRKEPRILLIRLPVAQIDLAMGDIPIAAEDVVLLATLELLQMRHESIEKTKLGGLSLGTRGSRG